MKISIEYYLFVLMVSEDKKKGKENKKNNKNLPRTKWILLRCDPQKMKINKSIRRRKGKRKRKKRKQGRKKKESRREKTRGKEIKKVDRVAFINEKVKRKSVMA